MKVHGGEVKQTPTPTGKKGAEEGEGGQPGTVDETEVQLCKHGGGPQKKKRKKDRHSPSKNEEKGVKGGEKIDPLLARLHICTKSNAAVR